MNTVVTSKEEILRVSRALLQEQGWAALNIRSVAAACGVSVGSIYNYFNSKAELVGETVESVWHEIFHQPDNTTSILDIQVWITSLYQHMEEGNRRYPGFFSFHSFGFVGEDKSDGRRRMQQAWKHILDGLCFVLKHDPKVRSDAFTDQFTPEQFADMLFSLMLSAMLRQNYCPDTILEMVRRTIYETKKFP